jgi:hypothetical protein
MSWWRSGFSTFHPEMLANFRSLRRLRKFTRCRVVVDSLENPLTDLAGGATITYFPLDTGGRPAVTYFPYREP